jgi:hypothetical protein
MTTLEQGVSDMNDDQLRKQIDVIQAGLRQARAEVAALHNRMGVLEHRLNIMDVRIVEVPLGITDLKGPLDIRLDKVTEQLGGIARTATQRRLSFGGQRGRLPRERHPLGSRAPRCGNPPAPPGTCRSPRQRHPPPSLKRLGRRVAVIRQSVNMLALFCPDTNKILRLGPITTLA